MGRGVKFAPGSAVVGREVEIGDHADRAKLIDTMLADFDRFVQYEGATVRSQDRSESIAPPTELARGRAPRRRDHARDARHHSQRTRHLTTPG